MSLIERERREFRYPPESRPRPGVIDTYQRDFDERGENKVVLACYSFPTDDPNIHDLKVVWRPRNPEDGGSLKIPMP